MSETNEATNRDEVSLSDLSLASLAHVLEKNFVFPCDLSLASLAQVIGLSGGEDGGVSSGSSGSLDSSDSSSE